MTLKLLQIGEAYQVLSNKELRKRYDKFGKDKAVPDSGFGKCAGTRDGDRMLTISRGPGRVLLDDLWWGCIR